MPGPPPVPPPVFEEDAMGSSEPSDHGNQCSPVEEDAISGAMEEIQDMVFMPHHRGMSAGFRSLDAVFEVRAIVMKTIPIFMRGVFRAAMKASLQEVVQRETRSLKSEVGSCSWGGLVPRGRLNERIAK